MLPLLHDLRDRYRWPRRRTRLPGPGRLKEIAHDPRRALAARRRRTALAAGADDERLIGLLLIRDEDDILEAMLTTATRWFDRILVLDGTGEGPARARTDEILAHFPEVVVHLREDDLDHPVRDGNRQYLLAEARRRFGVGHWLGILHADEFLDQDPRPMLAARDPARDPSVRVRLVHTFLHTADRASWDETADLPVRERVGHLMWPGVPEARFFFDFGDRDYEPMHHGKVVPTSLRNGPLVDGYVITQYNERDPAQLLDRARGRAEREWQRAHYGRLDDGVEAAFTDTLDRPDAPFASEFAGDPEGPFTVRHRSEVPIGPVDVSPSAAVHDLAAAVFGAVPAAALAELVTDSGRIAALRWNHAMRTRWRPRPGGDLPGYDALVRHTAWVLGSPRTTEAHRHQVAVELVQLVRGILDR